ncbi:hypothetical protein N0V93_006750 [Gnomoniopsis smithogilvyi]|uniref:Phospholipase/carboxylesterase/thioesterase domain-containing protein n=1 Tax=Gnomoniopsis smithogilvyi TaxID=1191159 RepID=A0A9W9CVX8_9PEZI|nr:hypothetical protein N0V93_006750 [Gnomoniopsis smithogilvyi]
MSVERHSQKAVVLAPSGTHKSTIILLHGRGRKANVFAGEMTFLQQALPHTKLVFPWAPRQRATVYKKSFTRQWFDDWHLSPDLQCTDIVHARYDEGLQTSGLGETVNYLHALIREESRHVDGVQNVVLGGFSQGAAASLIAALLWDEEPRLGGVVAMCAWLPYMTQMAEILQRSGGEGALGSGRGAEQDGDGFDPFERTPSRDDEVGRGMSGVQAVLEWLRDEIDLPQKNKPGYHGGLGQIPVLFSHGSNDNKVMPERSQDARDFLSSLGPIFIEEKTYPGVGHEISENMTADIAAFLSSVLGGNVTNVTQSKLEAL